MESLQFTSSAPGGGKVIVGLLDLYWRKPRLVFSQYVSFNCHLRSRVALSRYDIPASLTNPIGPHRTLSGPVHKNKYYKYFVGALLDPVNENKYWRESFGY